MELEGIADLPLHGGRVPPWLASIMKRLAEAIITLMVEEYGPGKVVERLSNPLWFQALNNVIGMDWDSSGSTTVTTGILREITWRRQDLGILVLGGKGARARSVPAEIPVAAERLGLPSSRVEELVKGSMLTAKTDSALLQDGYTLYHHALIVAETGEWAVIQQGMNTDTRMARRYHWYNPRRFVDDPHSSVAGRKHGTVLNIVASESRGARKTMLDLAREKPEKTLRDYMEAYRRLKGMPSILSYITGTGTGAVGFDPEKKALIYKPLPLSRRLLDKLRKLYEAQPESIEDLLLIRGVGPSTIRALILISDLVYGEPPSTRDPVDTPFDPFIYAYAVGGKDGVPYPVDKRKALEVVETLEQIIESARIGNKEKIRALKRLSRIKIRFRTAY